MHIENISTENELKCVYTQIPIGILYTQIQH